jgi:trans-aconitate 2-methyltransferase
MPTWDANLYLQFGSERTQPSIDLVSRINHPNPSRIIDLGCGPGNSTQILRNRWPEARITGLDNSLEMIAAAQQSYPNDTWILADAATWTADHPFDIVFSNAALHWMSDHTHLFPHLFNQVALGGAFAMQIPAHHSSPVHLSILEVAGNPAWSHLMDNARNSITRYSPSFYYDLIQPLASKVDLWETEYVHIMDSPQAIVNWFRGTGLRPFLEALETEKQKQQFERLLLEAYTKAYPRQRDDKVLFPFRRLFMVAYNG